MLGRPGAPRLLGFRWDGSRGLASAVHRCWAPDGHRPGRQWTLPRRGHQAPRLIPPRAGPRGPAREATPAT
eukprot:4974131-Pyramimonas_sp.AAC.1